MTATWRQLVHEDDSIHDIHRLVASCSRTAVLLERGPEAGQRELEALQVSTRSYLGAVAFHTGGIVIDGGWLRVLGAGREPHTRSIAGWNGLRRERRLPAGLLVGDDAVGGFYAWMGDRNIWYLDPDDAQWVDLHMGYQEWLGSVLSERLEGFYDSLRWPTWREDVAELPPDDCFQFYPPPAFKGPPLAERKRYVVPVAEAWSFALKLVDEMADLPDGATVRFDVVD